MRKKMLLLGGSHGQIPAIREAKRRGLYTILCDYLNENPGRYLVDEFHLLSTTDKEKVLDLAQEKRIDYILAYGSDPAVLTTSYVSSKLGLKGNKTDSIKLLTHKDLFRRFQREEGFNIPDFLVLTTEKAIPSEEIEQLLPAVIKPVDSSDTKGVSLVEKTSEVSIALEKAFRFTRCGRVIVEEIVDDRIANLNGDGLVIDGELLFCELGDHIFMSESDSLKPSSTLFPSRIEKLKIQHVTNLVAELIRKSGYTCGPVNIEVRINSDNEIYIMEVGPRNGGNYIPQAIYYSTGFNLLEALFDMMLDNEVSLHVKEQIPAVCFTLHSNSEGIFDSYLINKELESYLAEIHLFVKPGDPVKPYHMPGSSLGSLLFRFENINQVNNLLDNFYQKVIDGVHFQ